MFNIGDEVLLPDGSPAVIFAIEEDTAICQLYKMSMIGDGEIALANIKLSELIPMPRSPIADGILSFLGGGEDDESGNGE